MRRGSQQWKGIGLPAGAGRHRLRAASALLCALWAALPARAADAGVVSTLEVQPPAGGLELEVAGGDRFLPLTNGTGQAVVVKGYDDEPYLRFLPSRVVEVNTRSPSKYANEDRYALRPVPGEANSDAPRWQTVSRDGSYRWFDHRIHLMEKGTPPQVTDESSARRSSTGRPHDGRRAGGEGRRDARMGALVLLGHLAAASSPASRPPCSRSAPEPRPPAAPEGKRLAGAGGRGEPAEEAW